MDSPPCKRIPLDQEGNFLVLSIFSGKISLCLSLKEWPLATLIDLIRLLVFVNLVGLKIMK